MPTRRQDLTPPTPPAPRTHGVNKPVRPPDAPPARRATAPIPPPVARARGSVTPPTNPAPAAVVEEGRRAPTRIKVRAIRQGYYDHIRRHEGDVFYIAKEQDFSAVWMEAVDPRTPERVTTTAEALRRQHDEILAGRIPASGTPLVDDEPDADKNPLGA